MDSQLDESSQVHPNAAWANVSSAPLKDVSRAITALGCWVEAAALLNQGLQVSFVHTYAATTRGVGLPPRHS